MECPAARDNNEDVIPMVRGWIPHCGVVEDADYLSIADEECSWLKLGVPAIHHSLAQHGPRIFMNGEEHEDLERLKPPIGSFVWISGGDVSGQLDEAATFALDIV